MSIAVTLDFLAGASIRTRVFITDDNDTYADPSTVSIQITNPSKATVISAVMDKASVGVYEHYYNSTAPTGWYNTTITAVDGTGATAKTTKGQISFRVK